MTRRINLFQTPAHPCPYLEDQISVTQFMDPERIPNIELYTDLSIHGFRRSGSHVYRPNCPSCNACKPIRVLAREVKFSKSQKRIRSLGKNFTTKNSEAKRSDQHFALYEKYINARHADGDMYPPNRVLYDSFLLCEWSDTYYLDIYDGKKLIACAVYDQLADGISAVYSFFDPDYERYSLGTLCIIKQIEMIQRSHLMDNLYLGFQIDACRKMNYKTKFKPYQIFENDQWHTKA